MGWLTDLFTDTPLSPQLREKLAAVESEVDGLKTDNVLLKDDLREAKAQVLRLEKKLDEFTHRPELDEIDVQILKEIALTTDPEITYLMRRLNEEKNALEFKLQRLVDIEYLSTWSIGGSERYSLELKGREYLVKHKGIS
jgi:predicted  nucleic acid-binding Zn-ribbon protein